jgi:hypothetical protein
MSHELSEQHPPVVLRSRYQQLKALFALAAITVLCLTAAVVILAVNEDGAETAAPVAAAPAVTAPVDTSTVTDTPGLRFDGGPEEGSRGPFAPTPPADTRLDGGPEEGTAGVQSAPTATDAGRWGPH